MGARRHRVLLLIGLLGCLVLALTACGPESSRTRGGGSGADVGNKGSSVQLHGDEAAAQRIYYETPRKEGE